MIDHPRVLFLLALLALWLAAWLGALLRRPWPLKDDEREDFGIVRAACLTMLGLLIGFSFSMAISRYDLRKSDEAAEANAIGTEYVRTDLLPATDASAVRAQLRRYVGLRIRFYESRNEDELRQIGSDTSRLQGEMWAAVRAPASVQPTLTLALAVSGMNDVLNSQGYTQAAWWNRIPQSAWILMVGMAACCNLLVGYGAQSARPGASVLFVLPVVVAIALFLIADIDSPRNGFIHVVARNLVTLSGELK
jgi:hypothetical protein